jgi:hypothetical protein
MLLLRLLCDALALLVLLGGVGDGKTCEIHLVSRLLRF